MGATQYASPPICSGQCSHRIRLSPLESGWRGETDLRLNRPSIATLGRRHQDAPNLWRSISQILRCTARLARRTGPTSATARTLPLESKTKSRR